MEKIKKIITDNLYALSLYFRQIAGTLVLFVIARYLSIYDYGLFSSYKAVAGFILVLSCLGYNEYILVSSNKNVREVKLKISLFIINAILIMIISVGLSFLTNIQLHTIFMLVLLRTFFDSTFFSLILPYFQADKKFNIISFINIFYSFCVMAIAIISYIFKFSLFEFLLISCFIGFINFVQCSFYAKIKYLQVLIKPQKFFKLLDKSIWGYIGVKIAYLLYSQIPALFVSFYLSKENAALYFAAFTISNVIGLLIIAQNQKIVPEMMRNSITNIKLIIAKNFKFVMSINLTIFLIFCLLGKQLLLLVYGQKYYENAYFLLLIFTFSNICLAMANVYGAYITASGNQHLKIKNQIIAIFISIITLILFYKWNIYAAILAYFLSAAYIGIKYVLIAKNLINKEIDIKN